MFTAIFILCSGADAEFLKTCPRESKTNMPGIGATVFLYRC